MDVRVYDNGGRTFDRYTVIFPDGDALGIGSTGNVPNGFCMSVEAIEGEHLGRIVPLEAIPERVQAAVRSEWAEWYS